MCPILHISWDALWTPKMLYGHLNRHGHFLDIFLDIICTHFGLGHILDTFWTHFGYFLKTMCPKCVRPYIVNQSPAFVYILDLSNLCPKYVQTLAFFCPCLKIVQTLSSMSRFCPPQVHILS